MNLKANTMAAFEGLRLKKRGLEGGRRLNEVKTSAYLIQPKPWVKGLQL
jgi:hypothetical protein